MSISLQEVEILILESALESARQHEQRCIRRIGEAREAAEDANAAVRKLSDQINFLRYAWMNRRAA